MQVTPETIYGKLCTVIRRPFNAEWVHNELSLWRLPLCEHRGRWEHITGDWCFENGAPSGDFKLHGGQLTRSEHIDYTVTILPPLPRNPTKDDAWLLYLYASHGLFAVWESIDSYEYKHFPDRMYSLLSGCKNTGITHAVDAEGNKQEVAIV